MTLLRRLGFGAVLLVALAAAGHAEDVVYRMGARLDIPTSQLFPPTGSGNSIGLTDASVSAPTGYANQHNWFLSPDQVHEQVFGPSDYFDLSSGLGVLGNSEPPTEGGILVQAPDGREGRFFLRDISREIGVSGDLMPAYSFGSGYPRSEGQHLRLRYLNQGGVDGFIYSVNGVESPFLAAPSLPSGSFVGGFLEVRNNPIDINHSGTAQWSRISYNGQLVDTSVPVVPEPGSLALLVLGGLGLLRRRRRR